MSKYFGFINRKNSIERYFYKPEIKEKIEEYIKNACDISTAVFAANNDIRQA